VSAFVSQLSFFSSHKSVGGYKNSRKDLWVNDESAYEVDPILTKSLNHYNINEKYQLNLLFAKHTKIKSVVLSSQADDSLSPVLTAATCLSYMEVSVTLLDFAFNIGCFNFQK